MELMARMALFMTVLMLSLKHMLEDTKPAEAEAREHRR
jgi:hypothetical protein